jgi:glycosyltransferase involved in cell wall biosynthesis
VLIGDGPEHDNLRNQADRLGIGSRVHLLGQRPDVEDLVADLDVVVFPSLSEGLPIALLEAWCLARPVVATAVGGIPETLSDGENGRLVPPADADALARSVLELLKSPLHAKALGRGGREAALTRHVPGVAATAMIDFYRDVLLERAPQSGH